MNRESINGYLTTPQHIIYIGYCVSNSRVQDRSGIVVLAAVVSIGAHVEKEAE